MKVLLLHNAFPGHYPHIARALAERGHQVVFASLPVNPQAVIPGVARVAFQPARKVNPATHPYLYPLESAVLQGQAAYRTVAALLKQGFRPDLIYGHSGFGATLYMKDLLPDVPLVCYFEIFYRAQGTHFDFDPEAPLPEREELRIRSGNAAFLQDLYSCDFGLTPTEWQASLLPPEYRYKIKVIHDGIDVHSCKPAVVRPLVLPQAKLDLSQAKEIVTYSARALEPIRGFPQFMEALSLLLQQRPHCHAVVVGADRVEYDPSRRDGKTYKQVALKALNLDLSRVHFVDWLAYPDYLQVLQASDVHVYLTKPFVLSWSLLESMACGNAVVASDTPPVQEVIKDGENGLLVDFFSPQAIAGAISGLLDDKRRRSFLGQAARCTVLERYSLEKTLPRQIAFLEAVAAQAAAKRNHH